MTSISPFLRNGPRTSAMVYWTYAALLLPCALFSWLYQPMFILKLIGYTLLGLLLDGIYRLLKDGKIKTVSISSGLTAALIAASVPANIPFLPMLFSIIVAIWLVKLPNLNSPLRFNAAMVGRLFLMMAYANETVSWGNSVDGITTATPQELFRNEGFALDWPTILFGRIEGNWEGLFILDPGSPGETMPVVLLLLGILLCLKGIAFWRTPLFFLLSFVGTSAVLGDPPVYNLVTGATLFTAVFIVTDPTSTPMSKSGKIVTGIIIGVSNALLRHFTYYTETIVFAVLIGNLFTPLLDRLAFTLQGRRLNKRMENQ